MPFITQQFPRLANIYKWTVFRQPRTNDLIFSPKKKNTEHDGEEVPLLNKLIMAKAAAVPPMRFQLQYKKRGVCNRMLKMQLGGRKTNKRAAVTKV